MLKGEALAGQKSTACDRMVFDAGHRLAVPPIEISPDADKKGSLREGGEAPEIAGKLGWPQPRLAAALAAKNCSKWTQHGALLRTKAGIGRKKHPILLRTCGARLADMEGRGARPARAGGARGKAAGKGRRYGPRLRRAAGFRYKSQYAQLPVTEAKHGSRCV